MKIASYWKRPNQVPADITKGQLAELVLPPNLIFDYAIPRQWLNGYARGASEYERLVSQCVTCYPKGSVFGEIVNLLTGEVLP